MIPFEPALQWEIFGAKSYQEYINKILPDLYLKPEVPENIRVRFNNIGTLLRHAYYAYEFCDFGYELSLLTMESALTTFYENTSGKERGNGNLKSLMDWVFENEFTEIPFKGFFDSLRAIRNNMAHPKEFGTGGIMLMQWLEIITCIINDLYEDTELREKRKLLAKNLYEILETAKEKGFILESNKHGKLIIWQIQVPFINNKHNPPIYELALIPIFDPVPYKNEHFTTISSISLELTNVSAQEIPLKIEGFDKFSSGIITLEPILDNVNAHTFQSWLNEFETIPDIAKGFIMLEVDNLVQKRFTSSLKKFYKQ